MKDSVKFGEKLYASCIYLSVGILGQIHECILDYKVEQLNLSNNILTNITSDINRLVELQYLNLARNKLSSLPDDLSSLRSLRKLDLSGNDIKSVTDVSSIGQLPSLTVLLLARNPLENLEGLISPKVPELSNTSLDGLPSLTMLSLIGNPLKFIQKTWSPKLQWLDMSDCLLNYLRPDTFNGFPALEELRMSNNPTLVYSMRQAIEILSRNYSFNSEKYFEINHNVSRCNLDRPGLHGFPALTQARLSRNMINILPDRIFAKNRELGFLYLNANRIEKLNMSTFEGLVKLQVLDLSANGLEAIHPLTFHENVELKLLNLSFNAITEFPNFTSTMITLDASSNFISEMKGNFLTNMPRIRSINLSDNRLQWIPPGLKSTTLKNMDLRRNRLVEVYNDTFLELPRLIRIDLSGNRLTDAINPEIFRNNPNLNIIKLEDNPWRCDCHDLFMLYSFLMEPPAKTVEQSLICQSPANVSGYTWLSACFDMWNEPLYYNKDKTWGFVMIILLTVTILLGSFVSIRHLMRIKRRAMEQRQQLESLRLLRQRRNQVVQEELHIERAPEPRIHPLELVEPPTYEEAVQMPRLARSLDNLDEISVGRSSMRIMGSVDNIRPKHRRTRRPKKRIQSEDDLLRREGRRQDRIRRERNITVGNNETVLPQNQRIPKTQVTRRSRRYSVISDSVDSGSGRIRSRPQTPSSRKRRQRSTVYDGHSTDDEDSDVQPVGSSRSIAIRELRREPRSGYRESATEQDS
ncbi:hypothetical protein WN48_03585 [Eufriesea mexicana]|nr:hypothetical protein WN48_03585 [Eufriesea mexicana]